MSARARPRPQQPSPVSAPYGPGFSAAPTSGASAAITWSATSARGDSRVSSDGSVCASRCLLGGAVFSHRRQLAVMLGVAAPLGGASGLATDPAAEGP